MLLRRTLRRTRFGLALAPCDVASSVAVAHTDAEDGWLDAWREIEALPLAKQRAIGQVLDSVLAAHQ